MTLLHPTAGLTPWPPYRPSPTCWPSKPWRAAAALPWPATELHLTASAISHQVARLESQLGVRLFERSAHGVRLSAAGERYCRASGPRWRPSPRPPRTCGKASATACMFIRAPSLASLWLMPRLRAFAQAYPEISLNLSAAHTHSDFALGQADIDIRYGIPAMAGPGCRAAVRGAHHPACQSRVHQGARAEAGRAAARCAADPEQCQHRPVARLVQEVFVKRAPDRFAVRFDRAQMALDAATQGLGVALESATIAGRHIAERKLRPVFDLDKAIRIKAHFAVYPARHAKRAPVEAFLTWLHARLRGRWWRMPEHVSAESTMKENSGVRRRTGRCH